MREQRRFLNDHPELFRPDIVGALEDMLGTGDRRTRKGHQLTADLRVLAVATVAGSNAGVDDAYVDVFGALALDVPGWLAEEEQQLGVLLDERWRLRRTSERILLLRTAVQRATDEGV